MRPFDVYTIYNSIVKIYRFHKFTKIHIFAKGVELTESCDILGKAKIKTGSVAQWLEQGTHKPKVAGSNPA